MVFSEKVCNICILIIFSQANNNANSEVSMIIFLFKTLKRKCTNFIIDEPFIKYEQLLDDLVTIEKNGLFTKQI